MAIASCAANRLERLIDNSSACIAAHTQSIARSLELEPINTPVCSPQSNDMAESFGNTFRRDYLVHMDMANAATVLAQLAAAFEYFNTVPSHLSLKMRFPRTFSQH